MHVLFVHPNFPAQFGHIGKLLVDKFGYRCTFASKRQAEHRMGMELVQFLPVSGAKQENHLCTRTFENQVWQSHALFDALKARPDIKPDLIVGHSGFVSTLFLRELYDCPIINYFEYFYRTQNSDFDFRQDLPPQETLHALRARSRNAMLLLDLENCNAGYSPTCWQRERLPVEFRHKIRVIFDGIDMELWKPYDNVERCVGDTRIPDNMKIITYVSRGLESMRGFDIFLRIAKRLCEIRDDVVFLVIGEDRVAYGGDERFTGGLSFKQWSLTKDEYDLSRIIFVGRLPAPELARVFSLSDLHIYLTVPFVLSWSLLNALACGCTVLASDTAPVREVIQDDVNGLLVDFFDVEAMAERANTVLDNPNEYARLGRAGIETIDRDYRIDKCLQQMVELYEETAKS